MLEKPEDVESFMKNLDKSGAGPLSVLTKVGFIYTQLLRHLLRSFG